MTIDHVPLVLDIATNQEMKNTEIKGECDDVVKTDVGHAVILHVCSSSSM
jgi:hypothetical protein